MIFIIHCQITVCKKSIFYLKYGELYSRNIAFHDELNNSHVIPNNAIKEFRKFGKWVTYLYYL